MYIYVPPRKLWMTVHPFLLGCGMFRHLYVCRNILNIILNNIYIALNCIYIDNLKLSFCFYNIK